MNTGRAIKLHTLLDLRGNIPSLVIVTHGKVSDVKILDRIPFEAGSIYVSAFFVTRAKSNFDFERIYSHRVDKSTGLQCDQTIVLSGIQVKHSYPDKLRRIRYWDADTEKRFVFITNNFSLPAITIAQLYKCRWRVELFFKWIKQHLQIKSFYGTSENAVKTQVWIAISVYVLVAIMKKRLKIDLSFRESPHFTGAC